MKEAEEVDEQPAIAMEDEPGKGVEELSGNGVPEVEQPPELKADPRRACCCLTRG